MKLLNREINTNLVQSQVNSLILEFLQSDDPIAGQIKEIFKDQSINEIADNLAKLWYLESEDQEDNFLDFFVTHSDVIKSQNNRNVSLTYPHSNLGLVELVDELLDKLTEIFSKAQTILAVKNIEENEVIYADFSEMAYDLEYQQEALEIAQDFAYTDWEALKLSEV